ALTLTEEEQAKAAAAAEEYYESLSRRERMYIGIDKTRLKGIYEKYAIAQKLYNTLTQGINEEVSEDEARVIRVQQIYVKNLETANLVATKLAEGSDFVAIANTYNEAGAIENTVPRGNYPQVVDNIAFQMENNQQSEMITTEEGYYFIKCLSKYEQELTEQNKANILEQRRKEQFESTFSEFVQNASFELNENLWESVVMDTSGTIKTDSFFETYEKHFKGEK
ncbi:MAG: peptidyl-prolyl cis-trans isomerase, partial [Lachnospiraceae bacterium]|nr:peptidyl-prolyl cis-trans isomerase [Lachnospiraceae bacterium]